MKGSGKQKVRAKKTVQRGYTLLEYCMGAALLMGVVWLGMSQLSGSINGLLGRLSTWVSGEVQVVSPE